MTKKKMKGSAKNMDEKNIDIKTEQAEEETVCAEECAAEEAPPEEEAQDEQAKKIAELEQNAAELEKKAAELERQAKDYLSAAQRVQAEFDNFRRRNSSVRADAYADGTVNTVKSLLPVLDNFERALAAEAEDTPFRQGVDGIYNQFMAVLDKLDIELIPAEGEKFDPNLHEAVMRDEGGESGMISRVLQSGYMTREGRVIRFAMVGVYA